ncbi:MAG: hypothetical protein AB8G99_06100 [Planctomycetaceae bacterium]
MRLFSSLALLFLISGCQCGGWGNSYSTCIEGIAGRTPKLDACYSPCIDLTRIGHSDWCCCQSSRLWCPKACDKSCCDSGCGGCGLFGGLGRFGFGGCGGGNCGGGCATGNCGGGCADGQCGSPGCADGSCAPQQQVVPHQPIAIQQPQGQTMQAPVMDGQVMQDQWTPAQ